MKSNDFAVQMDTILDTYSKEVCEATNESIDSVSKQARKMLRNTSPKGNPHQRRYAESWTLKRSKGKGRVIDVIVHNKQYQLTHLLENGHVIRNAKGTYGRTSPIKHIEPVEKWANDELPHEIERKLK